MRGEVNKVRINELSYANGKNREVLHHEEDEKGKPQTACLESDNREGFAAGKRAVSHPASNPGTFPPSHCQCCENLPSCIILKNVVSCPGDFCVPQQVPNAFQIKGCIILSCMLCT